ncbi:RNA polymerase sigma factor [Novosphingobium sp. Gsoil 351]|uniref:RNA polymerase sigma factor n=1 Tax=Novosphingobium sp. Gsoil 351 TaxID=2675225 RepID=UPI0012B46B52|nr:RNA polymerase sigma factor [Novosphingobium sp. Gsoil 351]QGN53444.1 sigma-70 family RNA polymerase sigma factor [Novosphingobium sp. Gsoil 351]
MSLSLSDGSDAELAALVLAGRQDACRALLARHRETVFRLVRASIGDEHEALDLTQEAFIAAFAAIGRYDGNRPFPVWLKRIALNKCRDWARRRKVRSFFVRAVPLEAAVDLPDDAVPADVLASDRAELARAVAAISRLPARLREVLALRTIDELSQAEAAAVLGVSEKTVETRLYRARAKLKAMLGQI